MARTFNFLGRQITVSSKAALPTENTEHSDKLLLAGLLEQYLKDHPIKGLANMPEPEPLPVKGGRSSVDNNISGYSNLDLNYTVVEQDYPVEFLDEIKRLCIFNPDFGYAADNVKTLGSTDYELIIDDDVPRGQQIKIRKHVRERMKTWYPHSEGSNGLVGDLLLQGVLTGALSGEWVPDNKLSGVEKVVLVPHKHIKFLHNKITDEYEAHQNVSLTNPSIASMIGLSYKKLNPATYKYTSLGRYDASKPYGIPPFITAIENTLIEKDMLFNFKQITRRLGLFGFMHVLVTAPKRLPGETDESYMPRATKYLDDTVPELEKGLNKGFVVGFKDIHEFDMVPTNSNAEGAEKLFEMNGILKMAGLKQDPLMLGRNYATTETVGRVILAKLSMNITSYQEAVGRFLSHGILMDLRLAGYNLSKIAMKFDQPMIGDENRQQEAFGKKFMNYQLMYKQGLISQDQLAWYMNLDKPDQKEPREDISGGNNRLQPGQAPTEPDATGVSTPKKTNK